MDFKADKKPLRVRISPKTIEELQKLLDLGDRDLRRHKVGKMVRDNFRLRGWLKNKARGKPGNFKGGYEA